MRKRLIAWLALASLVLSCFAGIVPVTEVSATTQDQFLVGYSKKDINPWVRSAYNGYLGIADTTYTDDHIVTVQVTDPADPSKTIGQKMVSVPLAGYRDALNRLSKYMADDNGDGVVGLGDGLFASCTAVVDQNGTVMLFLTLDGIGAMDSIIGSVRSKIPAAIEAVGGKVAADKIMFSTSHSHEATDFDIMKSNMKAGSAWEAYYNFAVDQMVAAAVEAYSTRTLADMTKGEIDAQKATASMGYNNSNGYKMNSVRHYFVKNGYGTNSYGLSTNRWFVGSNEFNNISNNIKRTNKEVSAYNTGNTYYGVVAEANDTMYILKFTPANGAAPIVLVNWRAHPSFLYDGNPYVISSDYINSLRYGLEKEGYRVGFFQGAAGNINPRALSGGNWDAEGYQSTVSGETTAQAIKRTTNNSNIYGKLLAKVALHGLDHSMTKVLDASRIYTKHKKVSVERSTDEGNFNQPVDVIALGTDVMIVVAAGEYFDRYDANYATNYPTAATYLSGSTRRGIDITNPPQYNGSTITSLNVSGYTTNEWDSLVNNVTYGTPFFFGYSTTRNGYVPNTMAYDYNDNLAGEYATTPKLVDLVDVNNTPEDSTDDTYYLPFQTNSYEAEAKSCSSMARGQGEKIIAAMAEMVQAVNVTASYRSGECEHCDQTVLWAPLTAASSSTEKLTTGHYYLREDIRGSAVITKQISGTVCLDLNDCTIEACYKNDKGLERATTFLLLEGNSVLNIMDNGIDPNKTGTVIGNGHTEYSFGGAVTTWGNGSVCNLYGGTFRGTGKYGGTLGIRENTTINLYGGTIEGGTATGDGGTVYVKSGATFNVYGGTVKAGTAAYDGDCVYLENGSAKILLAGNARVDEIYFCAANAGTDYFSNMTVQGAYTGSATVALDPGMTKFYEGMNIGKSDGAVIPSKAITYTNNGFWYEATVSGTNLKLTAVNNGFSIIDANGAEQAFKTFDQVLASYDAGGTTPETADKYVKLFVPLDVDITIDEDVYLDLNGYDISGDITVNAGSTLYCMDSKTDDYDVEDGDGYGKITGKVQGEGQLLSVPADCGISPEEVRNQADPTPYRAGYLMVEEGEEEGISFHRVDLDITHVVFAPENVGVSYQCPFSGDQVVRDSVQGFGVALSLVDYPNAENLETDCKYTTLADFTADKQANITKSSKLLGVMSEENGYLNNNCNAQMPIYGSAYILTDRGYLFGSQKQVTMRQVVEQADTVFSESTGEPLRTNTIEMYKIFAAEMKQWAINNIRTVAEKLGE